MGGPVPLLSDSVLVVDNHVFINDTLIKYMLDHDQDMDFLEPAMNIMESIKQIVMGVALHIFFFSFRGHPLLPFIDSLFFLIDHFPRGNGLCAIRNVVSRSWVGGYHLQSIWCDDQIPRVQKDRVELSVVPSAKYRQTGYGFYLYCILQIDEPKAIQFHTDIWEV